MGYEIYEGGDLAESYTMFDDNPIYQGAQGEADLQRKLAEGWRIPRDHTYEYFSRRGTKLDVESPDECHALLDRVVGGLGMFIACQPFGFNPDLGRVDRGHRWGRELIAAAKILYRA